MAVTKYIAGAALAAGVCVKLDNDGALVVATDGNAPILGITKFSAASGDDVVLWSDGDLVTVAAAASIAAGTPLTATTAGAVVSALALVGTADSFTIGFCVRAISSTACVVKIQRGFHPQNS